jgi:hypothetical protein
MTEYPQLFVPTAADYADIYGDDSDYTIIDHETGQIIDERSALAEIEHKYHALALFTTPLQALEERDNAILIKEALKRKGASIETQNAVARYTCWCEHQAGRLLVAMPKNEGAATQGWKTREQSVPALQTLSDLGINKAEATRLRAVAELTEDEVKAYFEETDKPVESKNKKEITLTGLRQKGKAKKRAKRLAAHEAQVQESPEKPRIDRASWDVWLPQQPACDLLLTDPPYKTDIPDITTFAHTWLPVALSKVKPTGIAYVCTGAYPEELRAYLTADYAHMQLEQMLVWVYRNTKGPSPSNGYQLNWQAIFYFRGPDAPPLDCPELNEQEAAQLINAPDNRPNFDIADTRYHAWQKPAKLAEMLIRHSTKPGDLVLDLFNGTGTFALAATRLGRIARGCDNNPDMLTLAQQRGCNVVL